MDRFNEVDEPKTKIAMIVSVNREIKHIVFIIETFVDFITEELQCVFIRDVPYHYSSSFVLLSKDAFKVDFISRDIKAFLFVLLVVLRSEELFIAITDVI